MSPLKMMFVGIMVWIVGTGCTTSVGDDSSKTNDEIMELIVRLNEKVDKLVDQQEHTVQHIVKMEHNIQKVNDKVGPVINIHKIRLIYKSYYGENDNNAKIRTII